MAFQSPLANTVYELLKRDIVSGKWQPGERIIERALALEYHASRTPVRHAVQRLIIEGLLTRYGQRTISVTPINQDSIEEFYAVRSALEGLAAASAALKITSTGLAELGEMVREMTRAAEHSDVETSTRISSSFHQRIIEMGEHPLVTSLLDGLKAHTDRFRGYSLGEATRLSQAVIEHQWILHAMERHDAQDAQREMQLHVRRAGLTLLSSMKYTPCAGAGDAGQLLDS